jgi:threonine dehydratase
LSSTIAAPAPDAAAIASAHERIRAHIWHTPLEHSRTLSDVLGSAVYLKLECWQPTRSFKVRGAFNAVASLSAVARSRGLVTASAGNHGQAVALAAGTFGAQVTVFVPNEAPEAKQRRIRALGAQLDTAAADYDAAEVLAARFAQEHGATLVHAFSDDDVVAGQGTVGLEILSDLPTVQTIVVPVGGGGLIAGIGTVVKARAPEVRIIGVQSVETRVMYESLRVGHVVELPVTPTLADGLAGGIDARSLERVRRVVDDMHLVEEHAIAATIRTLFQEEGIVVEGSAAAGVAVLHTLRDQLVGPVAVVVTGGNIDAARFARILTNS